MKKTVLNSMLVCFTFVLCFIGTNMKAQDLASQSNAERAPLSNEMNTPNTAARTMALWDVLYNYDLSNAGVGGYAGVCFVGNEFWVSKWASDTISIFNAAGTFLRKVRITGVTGIRSMTYDGSFIYAGVNTSSVKKINPNSVAPTLAGTIAMPALTGSLQALTAVRFITFDATANSGAGGFWIGNFDTDLMQVSRTGAVLNTITASSHGLGAMYGAAVDNYSAGGPYIWICDQGALGVADMVQINVGTGLQTGVVHDVLSDVGLLSTGGLGGGIYLHAPQPGLLTLVGCLQGTPNLLYGYDMNTFVGVNEPSEAGKFLSVFPSVTNSNINIKLDKQNNNEASIQIIDAQGRIVFDKKSRGINNYINVADYRNGVYFVKVNYENGAYNTKFLKD